jgi:hypothetical protein
MSALREQTRDSYWAPIPEFDYLGDMSEKDYSLGFRYREVACPAKFKRTVAAVFHIDASNRIVRVHDPIFNRPGYVHQCFGIGQRLKTPAWYAVQLTYPDAKMALRSWIQGKDNPINGGPLFAHIVALLPTSDEY